MLSIRDACRSPFATITIVMVANGLRHPSPLRPKCAVRRAQKPGLRAGVLDALPGSAGCSVSWAICVYGLAC